VGKRIGVTKRGDGGRGSGSRIFEGVRSAGVVMLTPICARDEINSVGRHCGGEGGWRPVIG
jgi:hypothetical protein